MHNALKYTLSETDTLISAWSVINQGAQYHTLFVLNEDQKVMGAVTDGDLRRAILSGKSSESKITEAMNPNVHSVHPAQDLYLPLKDWNAKGILRLPILDENGKYSDCIDTAGLQSMLPFEVLILAGGKGSRLMPLTQDIPKPLLPVGGIPMIQRVIQHLSLFLPSAIHIALHHKADLIKAHCLQHVPTYSPLHFLEESQPLGTAGALSLLKPVKPWILVINADVISDIHLEDMYLYALQNQTDVLMATARHHVPIPYAVIDHDAEGNIVNIREKPIMQFEVNTGMYWLKSEVLQEMPIGKAIDMPDFIKLLLPKGRSIRRFLWEGLWADVGKLEDYRAWEHMGI
jgi:dTDP-glucose pyrophosphorylase